MQQDCTLAGMPVAAGNKLNNIEGHAVLHVNPFGA